MAAAEDTAGETARVARKAPGPKGLPVFGSLFDMGRDALGFFESLARDYGDVAAFKVGNFPAVLVSHPDPIEQVLVKQHDKYHKNKLAWRQVKAVMGEGVFVSEGEDWLRKRKMGAPAFATLPLEGYAPEMIALTESYISTWKDGQEFDIHQGSMALGLLIAAKTLFGVDASDDLEPMEKAAYWIMDEVAARFSRPFFLPDYVPIPGHIRYNKGIKYIDQLMYRIIAEERGGQAEARTFLRRLMDARDDNGRPMNDKQLRDEVCNMLVAGYETTALSISYGFHFLGQNRELQDRIAAEIRSVAGDRPLTHADLPNMPLTEWTAIESMRLLPPGWAIGRESIEDVEIGGYAFPKGTTVALSPWVTQRDPRFFDDPLTFRPERWAGDFRRRLPRFAYFPFGGGPRICMGSRFALMEAMLLLGTIVRRFDIERLTEKPLTLMPSVTLRPSSGVWVRLNARD
jgi:cytochrome P450